MEKNYKDVNKEMMFEMLALWLRREMTEQPVPTWNILLTTLSECDRVETEQKISLYQECWVS